MLTPDQAVDAYIAMWNAVDEERRQELADRALTGDVALLYPSLEVYGRGEAGAAGERYHREAPGFRIVLRSGVEQHHGWVRVAWHMVYAYGSFTSGPSVAPA